MKTDREFIDALMRSQESTWVVARWLWRELEYTVKIPKLRVRPDASQANQYIDEGDLFISKNTDPFTELRIEVKHRPDIHFEDDFPYETVFVDEVRKVDRADPKAKSYIIVNDVMTHVMVVNDHTQNHWTKVKKFDTKERAVCEYYQCPIEHVTFFKIREAKEDG